MRGTILFAMGFLLLAGSGAVYGQVTLLEDFNDAELAVGFRMTELNGTITANLNDAETWTFESNAGGFPGTQAVSPEFSGDAFTIRFAFRNAQRVSGSVWDDVMSRLRGLDRDLIFGIGLGQTPLEPVYIETFWAGWQDQITQDIAGFSVDFPPTVLMEIEFNGPGQDFDLYYTLDGGARTLFATRTADPGPARGPYVFEIDLNSGGQPLSMDLDFIEITGDITVEPPAGVAEHWLPDEMSQTQGQDNWFYRAGPLTGAATQDMTYMGTYLGVGWLPMAWNYPGSTEEYVVIDLFEPIGPILVNGVTGTLQPRLEWESPYNNGSEMILRGTYMNHDGGWWMVQGVVLHNGVEVWRSAEIAENTVSENFDISLPLVNRGDILTFTQTGDADATRGGVGQYRNARIRVEAVPPAIPVVASTDPLKGAFIVSLDSVTVVFDQAVLNVAAGDLTVNTSSASSQAATANTTDNITYVFSGFTPPSGLGTVTVTLAAGAIVAEDGGLAFVGDEWTYELVTTLPARARNWTLYE